MTEQSPTRTIKETAVETAVISGAFFIIVALMIFASAGSADNGARALERTAGAGELLYDQLGWTLSVYITVLLGFYAVSIGGQILGGQEAADATRRVLGFVAELMAAATICLLFFIVVYCWENPSRWPVFVVLVPVVGILIFLALQVGIFLVPKWDIQIAQAKKTRDQAEERLKGVQIRSRRRFILVWAANLLVIGIGAFGVMLPLSSADLASIGSLGLFYGAVPAFLLTANTIALYSFFTSSDRFSRALTGVAGPASIYLLLTSLIAFQRTEIPPRVLLSFSILIIATAATSFWPRRFSSPWFVDCSIKGVAAKWAFRSLERDHERAIATFDKLDAERPAPDADLNLLRRLRQSWKTGASDG